MDILYFVYFLIIKFLFIINDLKEYKNGLYMIFIFIVLLDL